jgi:hypothetical protein
MANFAYNPPYAGAVSNSNSTFERSFQPVNWVDGQDVVQASDTPTEVGFNTRMQQLQADLDAVKADLVRAYQLIAQLRLDTANALAQIVPELNKKSEKTSKEGKDAKEGKDTKEGKDAKDGKETKESKDGKETKETKEHKDGKETKETKERKDGLEKITGFAERQQPLGADLAPFGLAPLESDMPVGCAFIRPDERPPVGEPLYARESP